MSSNMHYYPDSPRNIRDRAPITRHDIVFAGFLQNMGTANGMVRIYRGIESLTEPLEDHLTWFINWDSDVAALAEFICRFLPANGEPDIRTYSYSYGVQTNMNFAKELKKRSHTVKIKKAVCCDGVYRHSYKLGYWRSAFDWTGIEVPDNIDEVIQFKQKNPRWSFKRFLDSNSNPFQPAGHTLIAEDPDKTFIREPVILQTQHAWIDDSLIFRNKCYDVVCST